MSDISKTCIVNFHGIGVPKRELETDEAPYRVGAEQFADTIAMVSKTKLPHPSKITFDDGNASDYDIALPVFLKHGLIADFYVLAGRIDKAGSLSGHNIRDLKRAGMGIGTHGFNHVNWTKLDDISRIREWTTARSINAETMGSPVTGVAIPFGSYNAAVISKLRKLGYAKIHTSDRGLADTNSMVSRRTSIRGANTLDEIRAILSDNFPVSTKVRRSIAVLL